MKVKAITQSEYRGFQKACDFFNRELFNRSLPQLLITFQRHARMRGYFSPQRFSGRVDETRTHEIALNPDQFTGRTDKEILSVLVHEMAHEWQYTHGEPSRRGYHNREWANKMKEVGLQPSDTGQPGGKETGQSVTHYIVNGGPYDKAYKRLAADGFQLNWQSAPPREKPERNSKTKFTCSECGQNNWAKPDGQFVCGVCHPGLPLMNPQGLRQVA